MNILITGAAGFLGRNLTENLKNLREGKNRTRPNIHIGEIYEYDRENTLEQLDEWCKKANFVFNLAGVNRPKDPAEFRADNFGFAAILLNTLKKHRNICPVMLSSSIQATLAGRFAESEYGKSKLEGEELFFRYAAETGAKVYVYRFPNLVGKWIKPNYNSAVGTFCHNMAHDLPIKVNDPEIRLELLFIDDLLEEMYDALEGKPHRCEYPKVGEKAAGISYDGLTPRADGLGRYCYAPVTYKVSLGEIVNLLRSFRDQPRTLFIPNMLPGSLAQKLYSMYLSYLPKEKVRFDFKANRDQRGSFTELFKTMDCGQFSLNISKPGVTKGEHWHNSKWEIFVVVSGHGLIRERRVGSDEIMEFEVSGEKLQAVHMLPGYVHSLINLSDKDNLVTLMWANEVFDPERPDTFAETIR